MVRALGALLLLLAASTLASAADDPPPASAATPPTLPSSSPEARHQEGLRLTNAKEYTGAERAYRDAIRLRPQ